MQIGDWIYFLNYEVCMGEVLNSEGVLRVTLSGRDSLALLQYNIPLLAPLILKEEPTDFKK